MRRIDELRSQVQRRTNNVYDTLFTRRVSIYVTALLAPTKVTANQVSVVAAAVALSACALIAFGPSAAWTVAGAACIHLYAVLDSVDGELARLRKTFSLRGLFIEDLSAYSMINGFNLAVGYHILRAGGGAAPLVLAIVHGALARNVMPTARRAILKSIATRRPVTLDDAARAPAAAPGGPGTLGRLRRFVDDHLLHYTNIWVLVSTLVAAAALTGRAGGPLVALPFVLLLVALIAKELAVLGYLLRGDRLERELQRVYDQAAHKPDEEIDGLKLASY